MVANYSGELYQPLKIKRLHVGKGSQCPAVWPVGPRNADSSLRSYVVPQRIDCI
jgi:hypothetical protein